MGEGIFPICQDEEHLLAWMLILRSFLPVGGTGMPQAHRMKWFAKLGTCNIVVSPSTVSWPHAACSGETGFSPVRKDSPSLAGSACCGGIPLVTAQIEISLSCRAGFGI